MTIGVEFYDALGRTTFSVTDRPLKILGTVSVFSGTNGLVSAAAIALGDPWWRYVPLVNYATYSPRFQWNPGVGTISWFWEGRSGPNGLLTYGMY